MAHFPGQLTPMVCLRIGMLIHAEVHLIQYECSRLAMMYSKVSGCEYSLGGHLCPADGAVPRHKCNMYLNPTAVPHSDTTLCTFVPAASHCVNISVTRVAFGSTGNPRSKQQQRFLRTEQGLNTRAHCVNIRLNPLGMRSRDKNAYSLFDCFLNAQSHYSRI